MCQALNTRAVIYSSSPPQENLVFSALSLKEKIKPREGECLASGHRAVWHRIERSNLTSTALKPVISVDVLPLRRL